ncbi:DUF5068 domain-containing protein [Oceanobacillus bengalensis]|uniref:DUF5068 domain-containing protein n=1 Tax=Oceanobacillus bengalensis TaxID=1435466 RepID=A0A494YU39_9BACI|nr:DUF5068 domain-containing protein [Oceanobacillus bengalensis]RKQ13568.1 DUF5068 domain-containing protein [Oceanobacillus bengalensis]
MFKKKWLGVLLCSIAVLILVACGDEAEEASTEETEEKDASEVEDEAVEEETESADEVKSEDDSEEPEEVEDTENSSSSAPTNENINPAIAEETDGNVEIIYTNNEAGFSNDLNGFLINVDAYQIAKVTDMNADQEFRFDGAFEGYVVTAKASIENTTDKDIYNNYVMRIQLADRSDYVPSSAQYYIPEDMKIEWENTDDIGKFEPGFQKDIFVTFLFTNEEYEKLSTVDPKFIIEGGASENDDFSDSFGEDAIFDFVYSEEQAEQVANAPDFYQDKLTTDNIATKEIIYEKTDINETKELDGAKITLEGVQYTDITPNESSAERFSNFDGEELVALTIKINIENGSEQLIWNNSLGSILSVNDDEARYISQGMVENATPQDIAAGETGEKLFVFLFEKKYFDIYETFDLEVGPFMGDDGELFKGHKVEFELPR